MPSWNDRHVGSGFESVSKPDVGNGLAKTRFAKNQGPQDIRAIFGDVAILSFIMLTPCSRLPHAQPPSLSSSPTNPSNMPAYAHHHHASSSASSPPTGSALSPSNSFSVATPGQGPTGIAIPGAGQAETPTGGLARSPSKSGGLSPNATFGGGLAGSGLMVRRPSAGVGVASIPIPGVVTSSGFDV